MTSTVSAASLTIQVKETINLHGYDQGSNNTQTIADIAEIQKRIVTVPTSEVTVLAFHDTTVAQGTFVEEDVRYVRFTNLDDTNHITLTFKDDNNSEFAIKIDAGRSFIYGVDNADGVADTMDAGTTALTVILACLVDVTALANTAACDMEMFVASI